MGDGLVSQLYRMTFEVIANSDYEPEVSIDGKIYRKEVKYNIFIYLPKADPKDMKELREYDERIRRIVTMA